MNTTLLITLEKFEKALELTKQVRQELFPLDKQVSLKVGGQLVHGALVVGYPMWPTQLRVQLIDGRELICGMEEIINI